MKALYLLILLPGCFRAMAQSVSKPQRPQLHVIFIMEQRELEFARLNMENDTLMTGFVETVHQVLNYPMRIRHLSEQNFTRKALQDTLAAIRTSPNDIIILYYAGYGIPPDNPADNFANWRLDKGDKTGLPVREVENWLRAKKVHLGLLIADCSTQRIQHDPTRVVALTGLSVDLTRQIIHQLFLRHRGIVKLGSSTPSTPGYVNLMMGQVNKYFPGTVFTNAFCVAFSEMLKVGPDFLPSVSFHALTARTDTYMQRILRDSDYEQTPVLEVKNWDGTMMATKQHTVGVATAESRWQGFIIDEYAYDRLPQKWLNQPAKRLPARVDMSAYAPPVINQGDKGTCVAVSIGYYMRSILEARKRGITNKSEIYKHSFSPFYLYNKVKMYSDRECTFGIDAGAAFEYVKQNGIPLMSTFADPDACDVDPSVRIDPSSRIEDYVKLFPITAPKDDKVRAVKQALAEFSPIVVGIQTTGSMAHLSFTRTLVPRLKTFVSELVGSGGDPDPTMVWQPNQSNSLDFGHAMCVVGYDDAMLGKGAFKLINSWGNNWGDKGYFWMSYDTFGKYAKYGYQAYLPPVVKGIANLLDTDLSITSGAFMNKPLPFTAPSNGSRLGMYSLTRPQRTGTPFKFKVNVKKQTYLYLITASEADSTSQKLLPLPGYKMIVTPGNRLRYPSDNTALSLSGNTGREYWLFLFSATAITDIDSYVQKINTLKGPFPDRVITAFGNQLTPSRLIRYKPKKMGFFLQNDPRARERAVPLLVTMNHVP